MPTRTSPYALRALIYLAQQHKASPIPGPRIAAQAGIPPRYLAKILADLVRAGILASAPGRHGGFHFRRSPREITLFEVLAPFEQFTRRCGPFASDACHAGNPCLAHERWTRVVESEEAFFRDTTIFEVAIKDDQARGGPTRRRATRKREAAGGARGRKRMTESTA